MKKQNSVTGRFESVHGKESTTEYVSWSAMMARCYNPNNASFKYYGSRGVVVCDRWQEAANFLADMGEKPSARYTLGRIDNNKGYEPGNCRWETPREQVTSRSTTKLSFARAREIRMLYRRGYLQKDLAMEFGVCKALISHIVKNQRWKEDG